MPIKADSKPSDTTNVQRVYHALRADMLDYRLSAGAPLREVELSEQYAASRTPVREALARLEQQGLVVRAGRSYHVRTFSLAEIEDIYELREALEKMTVRRVIERGPESALSELYEQIALYPEAMESEDIAQYNELGRRFHLTLAEHCGNARLRSEVAKVHDQIRMFRRFEPRTAHTLVRGLEEHLRIIRAIEARDVTLAEAEMRYHLQAARWMHREIRAGGVLDASSRMSWPPFPLPRADEPGS